MKREREHNEERQSAQFRKKQDTDNRGRDGTPPATKITRAQMTRTITRKRLLRMNFPFRRRTSASLTNWLCELLDNRSSLSEFCTWHSQELG